jgi:hypothetical protein
MQLSSSLLGSYWIKAAPTTLIQASFISDAIKSGIQNTRKMSQGNQFPKTATPAHIHKHGRPTLNAAEEPSGKRSPWDKVTLPGTTPAPWSRVSRIWMPAPPCHCQGEKEKLRLRSKCPSPLEAADSPCRPSPRTKGFWVVSLSCLRSRLRGVAHSAGRAPGDSRQHSPWL